MSSTHWKSGWSLTLMLTQEHCWFRFFFFLMHVKHLMLFKQLILPITERKHIFVLKYPKPKKISLFI